MCLLKWKWRVSVLVQFLVHRLRGIELQAGRQHHEFLAIARQKSVSRICIFQHLGDGGQCLAAFLLDMRA